MGDRAAYRGAGEERTGLRLGAWIGDALARLRADLAPAAMNRRILHRLTVMSDDELRGLGLTRQDLRDARLWEIRNVADFLVARRETRRKSRGHGRAVRRGVNSR